MDKKDESIIEEPIEEPIEESIEEPIEEPIEPVENIEKIKVDKRKKGNYKMTPARQNAVNKMLEARQKKIAEKRLVKDKIEVEKLKKKKDVIIKKTITQAKPKKQKIVYEEESSSEEEVVVVKRKRKPKKIIYEEEDDNNQISHRLERLNRKLEMYKPKPAEKQVQKPIEKPKISKMAYLQNLGFC